MSENLSEILDYLDRKGVSYTIDTNPSEEKVEQLKRKIERSKKIYEGGAAYLFRKNEGESLG